MTNIIRTIGLAMADLELELLEVALRQCCYLQSQITLSNTNSVPTVNDARAIAKTHNGPLSLCQSKSTQSAGESEELTEKFIARSSQQSPGARGIKPNLSSVVESQVFADEWEGV